MQPRLQRVVPRSILTIVDRTPRYRHMPSTTIMGDLWAAAILSLHRRPVAATPSPRLTAIRWWFPSWAPMRYRYPRAHAFR